jgi:hypothetical protein
MLPMVALCACVLVCFALQRGVYRQPHDPEGQHLVVKASGHNNSNRLNRHHHNAAAAAAAAQQKSNAAYSNSSSNSRRQSNQPNCQAV